MTLIFELGSYHVTPAYLLSTEVTFSSLLTRLCFTLVHKFCTRPCHFVPVCYILSAVALTFQESDWAPSITSEHREVSQLQSRDSESLPLAVGMNQETKVNQGKRLCWF